MVDFLEKDAVEVLRDGFGWSAEVNLDASRGLGICGSLHPEKRECNGGDEGQ